jgi:hypothetical protein
MSSSNDIVADSSTTSPQIPQRREPWMLLQGATEEDMTEVNLIDESLLASGIAGSIVVNGANKDASILVYGVNSGIITHDVMVKLGYGMTEVVVVRPDQVRGDRPKRFYVSCLFMKGAKDMDPSKVASEFDQFEKLTASPGIDGRRRRWSLR